MTDEEKYLLGDSTLRTATLAGKDDIEVYYVNSLPKSWGESLPFSSLKVDDKQYADSVIIAADRLNNTLAHESVHVLEDYPPGVKDHYPYVRRPTRLDTINLMITGKGVQDGMVYDSRRLTSNQQDRITGTIPRLLTDL